MRLKSLTVCGFRSFGAEPQTLECDGPLTVIIGANSHGKSSLVEAVEFLLSGTTTRVQLHDGAKSEFRGCLRNVHLPPNEEVWVEAVVEADDAQRGRASVRGPKTVPPGPPRTRVSRKPLHCTPCQPEVGSVSPPVSSWSSEDRP